LVTVSTAKIHINVYKQTGKDYKIINIFI
jgi:hypothetical protein